MITLMLIFALLIAGLGIGVLVLMLGVFSPVLIIPAILIALDVMLIKRIFSRHERIDERFFR